MTSPDAQRNLSASLTRGRISAIALLLAFPALNFILSRSAILGATGLALFPYFLWIAVSLLAGWRSLVTARHATARSTRVAWIWFGAGAIAWSTGIVLELVSFGWIDSYAIIVDARRLLYVVYPLTLVVGLFVLATAGRRTLGILNFANIGVIGSAMLICALLILLEPVRQSDESRAYVLFSITDLTIFFTATIVAIHLLWATNIAAFRAVVLLLGLSAIVHAAANIGYYVSAFRYGAYDSGLDIYWMIALMLHYWAAQEQDASAASPAGQLRTSGWIERSANAAQVLLPAALIIGIIAVAVAFPEHLTRAFVKAAILPIALFALFLGLREWALDRHRQHLVEELQESDSLHTHVLRTSPGVVVICGTGKGFPLRYVSENGMVAFGIDADNFDIARHVHPEDQRIVRDSLYSALRTGMSSAEFRLRNQDGAWRWVDFRLVLRHDADGNPAELIGTAVDITEQHNLQQTVQQTQRLESLGRLSGSIAHDFNNLLTTILGFADILLHSPELPPGDRDKAAEIKAAGERGAALTRQLLTFSRRHSVAMAPIDVNALIMDMRGMMERLLGDGVDLTFRPCEFPVFVEGNRNQLEQVVMNLILNARDAMPDGGRIEIAADQTISDAPPGDGTALRGHTAVISVTDEGNGMDESVQAQIFDPFFTTKEEGTGLGLATVHGIVRQHNGRIDVTSRPGMGTRFDVLLPATQDPVAVDRAVSDRLSTMGSERILVVDDQAAITRVIASALQPMGYSVYTANSADEAIAIASRHPFDLLLSDIIMPDCNGYELTRRLRQVRRHFLVIYMSGYTDDVLARQELRKEDALLLQKPLVISELAATIRQKIDSSAAEVARP